MHLVAEARSEERRVGKECRSRWSPDHYKKKAAVRRVAGLLSREGVDVGVGVVRYKVGGRDAEPRERAALGDGGAVVVGRRGVVDGSDRNRDGGRAAVKSC